MRMNKVCFNKEQFCVRAWLLSLAISLSVYVFGVGFTPTDGGLVVNLESGQRILLSVMIDDDNNPATPDVEYFVCHYPGYTGGHFNYYNWDDKGNGNILKLIPQDAGATEPSSPSIWSIDDPKPFKSGGTTYTFDGIGYTMWSSNPGGDPYTLVCSPGNSFKYQGYLTREQDHANICNAIFVVPTDRSAVTSFDPNNTMGRGTKFNGEKGYGFLGMPYREVYWLDIPRGNSNPMAYTNASVVSFNTTTSDYKYSSNAETAKPGQAMYAFADNKHKPTKRTIFRLYVLDEPVTSTCADSYFFAYDEQDYVRYYEWDKKNYTPWRKIYTIDRLVCMERIGDTKSYQTDFMYVPVPDSTYYYVGYDNHFRHGDLGANNASSQFKKIRELPVQNLTGFTAPPGACGRMVVEDTTSTADNLDVVFSPAGVFLRTNTGRNIRMRPNADGTVWTCEEMWHITEAYAALQIKATLFSGPDYSDTDPGVDIPGWSVMVTGTSVPVVGGGSIIGRDGWARIYTNREEENGAIEFVPANPDRHIHYDNNGFVGSQIPDQYPEYGSNSVTIEADRLVGGFAFEGWTTNQDGTGTLYHPGDVVNLGAGELTLYAKATYTGTIHVALSFIHTDGKRYFMTHPGAEAPRFSRARRIDEWTDAWQGMENAENKDARYVNTFKLKNDFEVEIPAGEFPLDPRRELRYGAKDSLLFYEYFAPDKEEYLGLYYTDPNTVLANNSWAGLFTSTNGWPDYSVADVQNTKLKSTHYLHRVEGVLTRDERSNSSAPFVKYNAAANQFDGTADEAEATVFQISRVRVADEHYVVIPDTTEEWADEITFGYHADEQTEQQVWSKLIGKQLMAVTKLGDDTVYFHPNRNKILTTAGELRLSPDYRLTESFTYIRDSRAESLHTIIDDNKPHMTETSNEFSRLIRSGLNSPMDIQYQGNYIDIVDTLRITLSTRGPVHIKDYYGRWKKGAEGLHLHADGSRHRDIIVRTKTYHYGPVETKLVLTPEFESYNFSPLAGVSKQINFTLSKVTSRQLLDIDGNPVHEEVYSTEDVTSSLALAGGFCSFTGAYFTVDIEKSVGDHVTIVTTSDNNSPGDNRDTLTVSMSVKISGVDYPVTARVPLMQPALEGNELIWSVVDNGVRYFIMAGSEGLIFRQFTQRVNAGNPTLYQLNTTTNLIMGSADAANSNPRYITPWRYDYAGENGQTNQQLTLTTEYGVNRNFVINGETPEANIGEASVLTYEYENINVNGNANFEEVVRLKYGSDKWLKFKVEDGTPCLTLTTNENEASVFYWGYLLLEYRLLNNGNYPDKEVVEFGYNRAVPTTVQTRYKANHEYSMLLDNVLTYCGWQQEDRIGNLTNPSGEWLTAYDIRLVSDSRFAPGASCLTHSLNTSSLTSTITPTGDSPTEIRYPAGTGPYVNIVDTLEVRLSLQDHAPSYRFKDKWSGFTSIEDAHLKIPLIRRTYHSAPYDSLVCLVDNDKYSHVFPSTVIVGDNDTHEFILHTEHRTGTNILNVDNEVASSSGSAEDYTSRMDLTNTALAEIRLMDEYGNTPDWCHISGTTAHSITVQCTQNGIRAPREAFVYIAYALQDGHGVWRYVNFRLSVSQPSLFQYANNQTLVHTKGASGDPLKNGMQQVHENRRVLYYYNPTNSPASLDQNVELPIRERGYYGWWRWYREGAGETGDSDIPAESWRQPPTNTGKFNYPFRIIGDSVWIDEADQSKGKKLVTMGRYTVFHNPARLYERADPPAKAPQVYPPTDKQKVIYVADLSNYYDNLPLSMKYVNQIDTAVLDTVHQIIEPTLSLREVFELHPWTEMADVLENYKYPYNAPNKDERYMEDHVVMAPLGNRLLLKTEQRYNYDNVKKGKHSESLLCYYMRDDNWATWDGNTVRQDSMIWCGGWDAVCEWFTYDPKNNTYTRCTHPVTEGDDFLNVPAKMNITSGQQADTVYYCLRARSKATTGEGTPASPDVTVDGAYYFNICRYAVIYHEPAKYGPKLESGGKAIITNDEIEQGYEVLERLNFDYNHPGPDYQIYPHPLPWADASYGYTYPLSPSLPCNRFHNDFAPDLPNMGEYGLINKIGYSNYWYMMEQHGGAENGYMIYCDGMASAGQVAALSLESRLCEGQKMYFSGYVGNPATQVNKSCPNFLFSVQGSLDGVVWEDITSYMTGDIQPSNKWYQIFFPIEQNKEYVHFRIRVYNMASSNDGNDFIIDDMCVFATKPPLIAYQANTSCKNEFENDSVTHVILRVDYQGFSDDTYSGANVIYTIENETKHSFITPIDGYYGQRTKPAVSPSTVDTVYGEVPMPQITYEPQDPDSIFDNLSDLIFKFEQSLDAYKTDPSAEVFRKGYVYEYLDDAYRPVMYIIHSAKMSSDESYVVRMAGSFKDLLGSICAMTSRLNVKNRMVLELNGEEQAEKDVTGMCANATYDISLRVKGALLLDNSAPIDINGSCVNDWLLYGDTAEVSSEERYGYKYSDIVKVVKDILRCEPPGTTNANQFARNLSQVNRNEMIRIQNDQHVELETTDTPYEVLAHLVNSGMLTLYRSQLTVTTAKDDSIQYVIFPIVGTGSDAMLNMNVEVCPTPVFIKLKSTEGGDVPMVIGGFQRNEEEANLPAIVLVNESAANSDIAIPIDSIVTTAPRAVVDSIVLFSTNDPDYLDGIHTLGLVPDRAWTGIDEGYYHNDNDTLHMHPMPANNYRMKPGYSYTFGIKMKNALGKDVDGCPVGTVPFVVSVVPEYLRWNPQSAENNRWNDPDNWIGITRNNEPIHQDAHFAPLAATNVIIPPLESGMPYPVLADPAGFSSRDSVKQTGFRYNTCDSIRFLAGAAMSQQQLLNCSKAVIDMATPQGKWALRAAPVTGMLSGDIFMADAELTGHTTPWEVAPFDAHGRSYQTGNASYWLSLYSRETIHKGNNDNVQDSTRTAAADWSKVTNVMKYALQPAQGWAVYTRTASGKNAEIRLPKNDDIYYYYNASGNKVYELYEQNLRSERKTNAGGTAGELAFYPGAAATYKQYTLTNEAASESFVFGNPTMGYIDIWGFVADNSLVEEISYIDRNGVYTTVTGPAAEATADEISNQQRYLPPMHAMIIKPGTESASLDITLNTSRIVTHPEQVKRLAPAPAPARHQSPITNHQSPITKGIMTVTAVNPVSPRCTSRLILGQGYHDGVREGEDALLTTINIDHYSNTSAPATPFNIYAVEGGCGLSINLKEEVLNVPVSFYMSNLPFGPVTYLWFTGVNKMDGTLVLYDALTDSERPIRDGLCLDIQTPENSHEIRYFIRKQGYTPADSPEPVPTDVTSVESGQESPAMKIVRDGNVLILRNGQTYTLFGQKLH